MHIYYSCQDGQFCIPNGLLCDGYMQCLDGSDEDPVVCDICPKSRGWPPRFIEKKWRATLKCQHRYNTNQTICAVPCDGIDDLCLNYEDEDNCKIPSFLSLISYVALAGIVLCLIVTCVHLLWKMLVRSSEVERTGVNKFDLAIIIQKGDVDTYHELRETQYFGSAIQSFIACMRVTENINAQREICNKLFDMERSKHIDEPSTHLYITKHGDK